MEELFAEYGIELTPYLHTLFNKESDTIKIPSKIEYNLKFITNKELITIHKNAEVAKELILIIVSNLSNTYILSNQNNATQYQKEGFKSLNWEILSNQVKYDKKITSPYRKILDLLIKYNVIEAGRTFKIEERSNEYRLTNTYFGKGIVEYTLKTELLKKRNKDIVNKNLENVLKCPIAKSELVNRQYIKFPTVTEITNFLKTEVKNGLYNKKGIKIVFAGKNPGRYANKEVVFAEKYINMYEYLLTINIPIIASDRGGNRVITTFNFMPSIFRKLCRINGKELQEADYSCLLPNIVQYLYDGDNEEMITHDKVANYLGVERNIAKQEHLSFFNKKWSDMYYSPLFKYYTETQCKMMDSLFKEKNEKGHKETSKSCFIFETELMRDNILSLNNVGITAFYCFDAIYVAQNDLNVVKDIMNKNADMYGILSRVN